MVYTRRRNYGRKRPYKKRYVNKRGTRKQAIMPRIGGRLKQPVHYFTRHVNLGHFDQTGGAGNTENFNTYTFKLADVPAYSEFVGLFRFFKLMAVKICFIPISNVTLAGGATLGTTTTIDTLYNNRFFSAIDNANSAPATNIDQLREYGSCKWTPGNTIHKRYFKPRTCMTVDEDGPSGSSYGVSQTKGEPWVSTSYDQCQYFGLKVGYQHLSTVNNGEVYVIEAKYYLAFKGPK